ncbi:MAG TPA: hypothetical protein VFN35_04390 [Ktedonobacteraceae bacterium]|nr:hypothetical protein [Ktedonobacteraceae bacterium]
MYWSFTEVRVIHEQVVQEAMERNRPGESSLPAENDAVTQRQHSTEGVRSGTLAGWWRRLVQPGIIMHLSRTRKG